MQREQTAPRSEPILKVEDLERSFGHVKALRGASLSVGSGQITAIVGDNGAGKSTLIRCLSGIHTADNGRMSFRGERYTPKDPRAARHSGIETVHQDLALITELPVWQNIFLSREIKKGILGVSALHRKRMIADAEQMLDAVGAQISSVTTEAGSLSGGQRQAVAIARAVGFGAELLIMDEPTAAMGVRETNEVEELMFRLRADGLSMLVISHDFEQVMRVADRVWVMRQGRVVAGRSTQALEAEELLGLVTGSLAGD